MQDIDGGGQTVDKAKETKDGKALLWTWGSCKLRVHWRRLGIGSIEAPHWLSPGGLPLAEPLLGEEDTSSGSGSEVVSLPAGSAGTSLAVGVKGAR